MKNKISYLLCILTAVFIAFYIDGTSGVFVTAFLIFSAVFSFINMVFASSRLSVSLECHSRYIKKGAEQEILLTLSKTTRIPFPFIEAEFEVSPRLSPLTLKRDPSNNLEKCRVAMGTSERETVSLKYQAEFFGKAQITLKSIRIVDYLGIFSRKLKNYEVCSADVCIIPEVAELSPQNNLLKEVFAVTSSDDNADDETSSSTVPFGSATVAGYEHRPYEPGDPVKKINWKLSSKKNSLMVRLDEAIAVSEKAICIDFFSEKETPELIKDIDLCIQSACGFAKLMIRSGAECIFCLPDGSFRRLSDETSVSDLCIKLSEYTIPQTYTIPFSKIFEKGIRTLTVFGNNPKHCFNATNTHDITLFYVQTKNSNFKHNNLWTIDNLFNFSKSAEV